MNVRINDQVFEGVYLTDIVDIQRGMMNKSELNGCMIFKMGSGYHSFWMKNCLINLDIVFVNKGVISKIHHNCPPADPHSMNPPKYKGIGDHVIEFPGGTCSNMKVGDKVNLYLGSPLNPREDI